MARPGDEVAAGDEVAEGAGGHSRPSHADRELVIDVLKAAFVQGRLDMDEFDPRVDHALAARTCAELAAVTADLPAAQPAAKSPEPARARRIANLTRVRGSESESGAEIGLVQGWMWLRGLTKLTSESSPCISWCGGCLDCEPDNRLVARTLEARWEARLADLAEARRRWPSRRRPGSSSPALASWRPLLLTSPPCGQPPPPATGTASGCCSPFWPTSPSLRQPVTPPGSWSGCAGSPGPASMSRSPKPAPCPVNDQPTGSLSGFMPGRSTTWPLG